MNLLDLTSLALMLVSATSVLSLPSPSSLAVKESVFLPQGFVERSTAPNSTPINLRIALSHRSTSELKEILKETSDPESSKYGQHLSREEVNQHLKPKDSDIYLVRKWLEGHGFNEGFEKRSQAGDWLEIRTTVGKASEMLNADFGVYSLEENEEKKIIRTTEYSLPRELHGAIDLVDVTYFSRNQAMRTPFSNLKALPKDYKIPNIQPQIVGSDVAPASCYDTPTTFACLSSLYQTKDYLPNNRSSNTIAITGYLGQHYSYSDLQSLEKSQKPKAIGYNPQVILLNGGTNVQDNSGVEADLDVDTVTALTYPINSKFFSTGGEPPFIPDLNEATNGNEPYSEFFTYLLSLNDNDLPKVITTSYGDDEQTVPLAYARKVCDQIMALGSRGVSVIFASGDFGVGKTGTCKSNDGRNTTMFVPAFPASCPYSTTVGATEKYTPERAVSSSLGGYFGGGGFSNYFEPLDFMKPVQQSYIQGIGSLNDGLYNKTGRGYPDVSAQGSNYLIQTGGTPNTVGGTSASCPTFSSVIALLNDYRLKNGKSTLGFLNPLIYSKLGGSKGLFDVTQGQNEGCGTDGFPAKAGWDAATGFGTPRFSELQKLV